MTRLKVIRFAMLVAAGACLVMLATGRPVDPVLWLDIRLNLDSGVADGWRLALPEGFTQEKLYMSADSPDKICFRVRREATWDSFMSANDDSNGPLSTDNLANLAMNVRTEGVIRLDSARENTTRREGLLHCYITRVASHQWIVTISPVASMTADPGFFSRRLHSYYSRQRL